MIPGNQAESRYDLAHSTLIEMMRRSLPNGPEVAKLAVATIGGHLINLRHKGMRAVKQGGKTVYLGDEGLGPIYGGRDGNNLRCHAMLLGEKGTGKDIWKYQFFFGEDALLKDIVPAVEVGGVTNAGIVGSKVPQRGGGFEWERGELWEERNSILFFGEFDVVTKAMKSRHSSEIVNSLLAGLDHGLVSVNQAGVKDKYVTNSTFFACNQPERHEKMTGFDRRFTFHRNRPPTGDMAEWYKRHFAEHKRGEWRDDAILEGLRDAWRERVFAINDIESISLSKELSDHIVRSKHVPYDMQGILTNAIMGHHAIAAPSLEGDVEVPCTDYYKILVWDMTAGRKTAHADPRVYDLLKTNTEGKGQVVSTLQAERIALSRRRATEAMEDCVKANSPLWLRYVRAGHKDWVDTKCVVMPTGLTVKELRGMGYQIHAVLDGDGQDVSEEEW